MDGPRQPWTSKYSWCEKLKFTFLNILLLLDTVSLERLLGAASLANFISFGSPSCRICSKSICRCCSSLRLLWINQVSSVNHDVKAISSYDNHAFGTVCTFEIKETWKCLCDSTYVSFFICLFVCLFGGLVGVGWAVGWLGLLTWFGVLVCLFACLLACLFACWLVA